MVDNNTIMESGKCIECGANEIDELSCYEMFQFLLVWEHNDSKLYQLHFWLVCCYMIQHPSNFTKDGYHHLINLFIGALKIGKITNPLPNHKRKRIYRSWCMTIEDVYSDGEKNAINNIHKWKETIRKELKY